MSRAYIWLTNGVAQVGGNGGGGGGGVGWIRINYVTSLRYLDAGLVPPFGAGGTTSTTGIAGVE